MAGLSPARKAGVVDTLGPVWQRSGTADPRKAGSGSTVVLVVEASCRLRDLESRGRGEQQREPVGCNSAGPVRGVQDSGVVAVAGWAKLRLEQNFLALDPVGNTEHRPADGVVPAVVLDTRFVKIWISPVEDVPVVGGGRMCSELLERELRKRKIDLGILADSRWTLWLVYVQNCSFG